MELSKNGFEQCRFHVEEGCSIYADRPHSCREYQCYWLAGNLPEDHRPDKAGFVLDNTYVSGIGETVTAYEIRPGSFKEEAVWYRLKRLAKEFNRPIFLNRYGVSAAEALVLQTKEFRPYIAKLTKLMVPLHYG